MIITCEACGTSFKLKTSLVKETGSTVRCSKCQRVFIAYPTSTGIEKPTAFKLDKSLEAKIDDVLGDEFDDELDGVESEISLKTSDIAMDTADEKVPGGTFEDEFGDLESEISMETAEIPMATSDDLFDSTASLLDALEEGSEEPEIMMSELLQDDDDVISLDALEAKATSEALDMDELLVDDGDSGSDILSFEDLESKAAEKDDDFSALLEEEGESDIAPFDDIEEKVEDEIILDNPEEEPQQDLETMAFDDLESEEVFEQADSEKPSAEEQIDFLDFEDSAVLDGDAEPEQITVETKGGVGADLDEFDVTQEPEKPAKKPEKEKAIDADEDDFELDFDLDEEPAAPVSGKADIEKDEFEMDLDLSEEISGESMDDDLGLDLDEFEDLDLGDKKEAAAAIAADEDDFDLDLDIDAEETAGVSEKKGSEAEDLDLDLDMDGFEDLDLAEEVSGESLDDDLGLDLDEFGDLDLDEGLEKESTSAHEDTIEDFDLDFDLEGESKETPSAKTEKDDFDLDFDLDAEAPGEAVAEEESFDFDLDIEPETTGAKDDTGDFDLDLDFGETFDDKTATVSDAFTDESRADESEDFDLTQIEDVLDFDESPKPEKVKAGAGTKSMAMEMDEPDLYTASDDDDMNIDLETILDEGADDSDRKEVSLETVEQRDKELERQYKKTVIDEEEPAEEVSEDLSREIEGGFKAAAPAAMAPRPKQQKGRNLKKILVGLLLLVIIGAIGFLGWKMFGGKEETPPPVVTKQVKDLGNLQMEMLVTPEYKFVENKSSGELLVINGNVTNRYDHPRSNVQVKGTLYNNAGKVIISSTVYCGNMFTDAELTDLDIKTIEGRLNNRTGDNQMNSGITSGQSVPFTVIFKDLPPEMDEFTVEVTSSVK